MKTADVNDDGNISREEFLHMFKTLHIRDTSHHEDAPHLKEHDNKEYIQEKKKKVFVDNSDLIKK